MRKIVLMIGCLLFTGAQNRERPPLVLISIDGLMPETVLEADKYGLKIPNLRRILAEGAHATGVTGVLPTVTFPSHTTMVTGVSPARHGIVANTPLDPLGKNSGGWYWYAEDIKEKTLWKAVAETGARTASVDWPATVAGPIDYNIVQYWRTSTPDDLKLIRALSTPGLLAEAESAVGAYPGGNDYSIAADHQRTKFNVWMLQNRKPQFLTSYLSGLDTVQHESGPHSRESLAAIEEIDQLVGQIRAAAEASGNGQAIICIVSDHGFARTDKEVHLNAALAGAGLIEVDAAGTVKSWKAYAWNSGGLAAVMIDGNDRESVRIAENAVRSLEGVHRIVGNPSELGGYPKAAFVVALKLGYRTGNELKGPVNRTGRVGGTHGYLPELPEMNSSFYIAGPEIAAGRNLGRIDMRDIAPTIASLLGVSLPAAEGRNVLR